MQGWAVTDFRGRVVLVLFVMGAAKVSAAWIEFRTESSVRAELIA